MRTGTWRLATAGLVMLALGLLACGSGGDSSVSSAVASPGAGTATVVTEPLPAAVDEAALLDAVFRIDIDRVEAVFDLFPADRRVQVQAAVTFRMRPGQTRPIVHLEFARSPGDVALRLDGQDLDAAKPADARLLSFQGSGRGLARTSA